MRNKYVLTAKPIKIKQSVAQKRPTMMMDKVIPSHINKMARFLVRLGMPSDDCQSRSIGPKYLCSISQLWKRSDDFEKHQAANKTRGVVGNKGKKIPMMPVMSENQPKIIKKIRFPCMLSPTIVRHVGKYSNVALAANASRFAICWLAVTNPCAKAIKRVCRDRLPFDA